MLLKPTFRNALVNGTSAIAYLLAEFNRQRAEAWANR